MIRVQRSTAITPFIFLASLSSTLTSLAPMTGLCSTDAYTIPSTVASIPYTAVPLTLSGTSGLGAALPKILKSFGSFNTGFSGAFNLDAASANSPYPPFFPDLLCVISPFSAVHSAAGTFHTAAAASTSICFAAAPTLRSS